MNAMEALQLTRIVRAAFPAQRFDEFTIDVWADALRDEDYQACREALRRLVGKQTFASVAEIIGEAKLARREGMRRVLDRQTFAALEAARDAHEADHDAAHAAYLETRQAFEDALAKKRAERGDTDEVSA